MKRATPSRDSFGLLRKSNLPCAMCLYLASATGARWNIAVTTAGSGPSPSPTATIKSAFGKTVTVPIKAN
jgi:hypothetical protein